MAPHIAVVDIGTSSVRVSLIDRSGRISTVQQKHNPPTYGGAGSAEQDPTSWPRIVIHLLRDAVRSVDRSESSVVAVALTAFRSPVIPLDGADHPLRDAMMWQDTRPHTICQELTAQEGLEADVYRRTGTRILSVFSAPKIMWIARHEPAIAAAAARYVGVQDIVLHTLTGRFVTDRTFAGRSLLYNVHAGDWDDALLDMFQVPRSALSDLLNPGDFVGGITKNAAEQTGLDPDTPVITAGGDQQCAALGMGLTDTDRLVINTGTGSYVLGLAHVPQTDTGMRFFSNPAATQGHFTVEASLPATGSAYRWLNRTMFNRTNPDDFSEINDAALRAPAGANGVHLTPHLQGSGTPDWNSNDTGTLSGITLATSPDDIARAMIEGIAEEIARAVHIVIEQTGYPTTITSSGGLTSFPLFTSILESQIGMSLKVPAITESTSRGAWAVAAASLGWYASPAAALVAN